MSRMQQSATHTRTRNRLVAGLLANVTRGPTAIATGISVVPIASDRMITAEGVFLIDSQERAWIVGIDQAANEFNIGDLITVEGQSHRICEGTATQKHWTWWGVSRMARVYTTRIWT